MKKVYQRKVSADIGDCMQCAIASLFEDEYEDVPAFKELGSDWFKTMWHYLATKGYTYSGMLHNKKHSQLTTPTSNCFKDENWQENGLLTIENLAKESGVDGLFFASVLSPKYFNWNEGRNKTHAVIIDKDCNVVFDPNPEYKDILRYPLSEVIGMNGIINVYLFDKA